MPSSYTAQAKPSRYLRTVIQRHQGVWRLYALCALTQFRRDVTTGSEELYYSPSHLQHLCLMLSKVTPLNGSKTLCIHTINHISHVSEASYSKSCEDVPTHYESQAPAPVSGMVAVGTPSEGQ